MVYENETLRVEVIDLVEVAKAKIRNVLHRVMGSKWNCCVLLHGSAS